MDDVAPAVPTEPLRTDARILVVEDEDLVRMLVTETLEESGYITIEAGDAHAALRILQSEEVIDLMVTDIGLPGMNGRDLGEAARKHRPDLKILFMTGYAPRGTMADIDALGGTTQVLSKPFSVEVLADKVDGMMGR